MAEEAPVAPLKSVGPGDVSFTRQVDAHVELLQREPPAFAVEVALRVLAHALESGDVPEVGIPLIVKRLKGKGVDKASGASAGKEDCAVVLPAPAHNVVLSAGRGLPAGKDDTRRQRRLAAGDDEKEYIGRPTVDGQPRVCGAPHRKTLEERIWGAFLDAQRPRPPEKELQEAFAFLKKIDKVLARKLHVVTAVDVCGGHGLLAMLMLMLGKADKAVVLDLQFPPSSASLLKAFTAAGLLRDSKAVTWVQGDCIETLPVALASAACETPNCVLPGQSVPEKKSKPRVTAVCGIHACNYLTDVICDAAVAAGVPFALMPCCHSDRWGGTLKQAAAVVGLSTAAVVDVARMGAIHERGYSCHMFSIPAEISPVNRILVGIPRPQSAGPSTPDSGLQSEGLEIGGDDRSFAAPFLRPATLFSEHRHKALRAHATKRSHAPNSLGASGVGPVRAASRFSPSEHASVIKRALALHSGGRGTAGELAGPGRDKDAAGSDGKGPAAGGCGS